MEGGPQLKEAFSSLGISDWAKMCQCSIRPLLGACLAGGGNAVGALLVPIRPGRVSAAGWLPTVTASSLCLGTSSGSWSLVRRHQGINTPSHPPMQPLNRGWEELKPKSPGSITLWAERTLLVPTGPPQGWALSAHTVYLLHNALFIGCLCLQAFLPQAPSCWCFLGSPPEKLALVSRSASGETKLKQLAKLSGRRTSPLPNGC